MKVLPSGQVSTVKSIVTFDGELSTAQTGQAVTLTLQDEIDVSRGDLIVPQSSHMSATQHLMADVVWMTEQPLECGREYDIKLAGKRVRGKVDSIHYQYNINNLSILDADKLPLNGIGFCEWTFTEPVACDAYGECQDTGGFIIIDRLTNVTVGAAMVREKLELEADNKPDISQFEIELNALVRKHFPHWQANDLSQWIK